MLAVIDICTESAIGIPLNHCIKENDLVFRLCFHGKIIGGLLVVDAMQQVSYI